MELGHKKERKGRSKDVDREATTEVIQMETTTESEVQEDNSDNKKQQKKHSKAKQDKSDECSVVGGDSIKKSRQVLVFGIPVDINKKHFKALATRGFKKTEVDLLKEVSHFMVNRSICLEYYSLFSPQGP